MSSFLKTYVVQFYWPHWWALWPRYHADRPTPIFDDGDGPYVQTKTFSFGPLEIGWYTIRPVDALGDYDYL
jgi:hypothetical protein